MSSKMNQPSLVGDRVTVEFPTDAWAATQAAASAVYDDDIEVYDGPCRALFMQVQVSEAMVTPIYVLVFDARSADTIRTGRLPLFDAPLVDPGGSFTFSEPVVERDPDGFPFDRGLRVIASTSKTYDPANVIANAIKVTARLQTKDRGERKGCR